MDRGRRKTSPIKVPTGARKEGKSMEKYRQAGKAD